MAALRVRLELLSPACVADRPTAPGQIAATLGYLNGAVIRGGLAARWLTGRVYGDWRMPPRREKLDDAGQRQFRALFLDGAVRFGPGWPHRAGEVTWVVPQTAWTAKRGGGWQADGKAGVQDVLTRLLKNDPADLELLDELVPVGGEFVSEARGSWSGLSARRRIISRSAINADSQGTGIESRGVAAEGQLYSFDALESGNVFRSVITGPTERLDELQNDALTPGAVLTMGRGRARGGGQVQVRSVSPTTIAPRDTAPLIAQAEEFSLAAGLPDDGDEVYLPVTLESDTILRDQYLLPCSSGDPTETLGRYLPGPPQAMVLTDAIQSTHWIGGWDMIRELPRPPELAVRQGSVWVYKVDRANLAAAVAWWADAEVQGLGERLGQGYGKVRLLHPLHTAEAGHTW